MGRRDSADRQPTAFMGRYMKRADISAGVYGDKTLDDGEWVIKAKIEEIKGKGMDLPDRSAPRSASRTARSNGSTPELRW